MSIDRLQQLIRNKKNPTVAGLDPRPEYVPPEILEACTKQYGETLEAAAEAYYIFNCGLIDALCDVVPAVKPQSAYYEMLSWEGVRTLKRTIDYAKEKGLYVICDAKRNDIGSTAEAYSEAYLGQVQVGSQSLVPFGSDSMTVNAYLGSDGIKPFIQTCVREGKSIFALVKTSNPSSGELQDLLAGDRELYVAVGDLLARIARDTIGESGYSCVGAVVGATYPSDMWKLRQRLEHTFFLVPGYGAQGGSAADVASAFDQYGHGAIINSSRAIMCAWKKTGQNGADYQEAARAEAIRMRDEIRQYVTVL